MRSLVTSLLYLCYIKLILFIDLLLEVILAFFINFRYEKMMNYSCCFQEENKFIFCNSVQCDRDKRENISKIKLFLKRKTIRKLWCALQTNSILKKTIFIFGWLEIQILRYQTCWISGIFYSIIFFYEENIYLFL